MSRKELFKKGKTSVDKIKEQYRPEKIFIFGSFAIGYFKLRQIGLCKRIAGKFLPKNGSRNPATNKSEIAG